MSKGRGGKREGAGRKPGSKNKLTIAKEVVAEIIDADDPRRLTEAVHARGQMMLLELERIALDPTQHVAARIMAAKTALPFMLTKKVEHEEKRAAFSEDLVHRLQAGRERLHRMRMDTLETLEIDAREVASNHKRKA